MFLYLCRTAIVGLMIATSLSSGSAEIFDKPENLKILPEDISAADLRQTMRGFSMATGHRCEGCHVGEAGKPLDTFDFPADDKKIKKIAREMIKMVKDINQRLEKVVGSESMDRVKVECMTCHRGQNKPEMLEDVLVRVTTDDGLLMSTDKYRSLRREYYGSHTFDFSEMTLITVATRLAKQQQKDAAKKFLDINLEFYPESWMSYLTQGQLLEREGDKEAARDKVTKALEIEPNNPFLQRVLKSLE